MNVVLSIGARGVSMAVALVCGVLTARLVLGDAGVEFYALYTLIASLPGLISFSDLGAGAVVVTSIAESDSPRDDRKVRVQITTVGRIMVGFAGVAMLVNSALFATGLWSAILGDAGTIPHADAAAFISLTIFCLGVPLGIWQRVLLGLGKNHWIILVQTVQSPLNLLLVWLLVTFGSTAAYPFIGISTTTAGLVVAVLGFTLAARATSPLLTSAARDVPRARTVPGAQVMHVGWPMLVQLLSAPLAVSLQRYILAQSGTSSDVAVYGAAAQVFFAINGVVTAGGLALWPLFARARAKSTLTRGPFLLSVGFATSVAALCAMVWLVSPWLFGFITDGTLVVGTDVILAFSAMVVAQAALYPLGMFIMDAPGIRFQVIPVVLMTISTLVTAILITPVIGTAGPVIANAASVAVFQILPFAVYIVRHRARLLGRAPETDR